MKKKKDIGIGNGSEIGNGISNNDKSKQLKKKFDYFLFPVIENGVEKTQFKARPSQSDRLIIKSVKNKDGQICLNVKGSSKVEITEAQIRTWAEMAGPDGFFIEPKKSLSVSIGDLISKK